MANRTNPWNIYAKRYKHNKVAQAIIIGILCFIALALMVFLSTYS